MLGAGKEGSLQDIEFTYRALAVRSELVHPLALTLLLSLELILLVLLGLLSAALVVCVEGRNVSLVSLSTFT